MLCRRPPLWSSGQSSWLQIQRSGFDSWRYHIFWEVVVLERGPLSLMSTIEELLERKSSGSGLETENMAIGLRHADHVATVGTNFADRRLLLGRYSSFATELIFLVFVNVISVHIVRPWWRFTDTLSLFIRLIVMTFREQSSYNKRLLPPHCTSAPVSSAICSTFP
jgi:hypothetical protein